jgi:hypothetical protein
MSEKEGVCLHYLVYHYYQSILNERSNHGLMKITEAKSYLFQWRLPNYLRTALLKEMELMGLIEKVDNLTIKINHPKIDIQNPSLVFDLIGLIPKEK